MVNASIKILQKNIFLRYWPLGCVWSPLVDGLKGSKVGCVFPLVVVSILPHADFGRNDHREDAPHFNWRSWKKRHIRKDKRCKRTWFPASIFSQGNINNFRFWSSSKINICQEWIVSSYQKGGSNKRQENFKMSKKCHSIVILVSPYHISLSSRRRQTVSPGDGDPEGAKVDMRTFQTSKDGQGSSRRHNFIDEIFHQHFYLLKYQKLFFLEKNGSILEIFMALKCISV